MKKQKPNRDHFTDKILYSAVEIKEFIKEQFGDLLQQFRDC